MNSDPLPKAWQLWFVCTISQQVADALQDRLSAPAVLGDRLTIYCCRGELH